jgi:CheY-like chemotaxis protein
MERRRIVLLVDDSTDNRMMYAEYLAFEGFGVLEADNGVEAVATVRRELPDAVVMDVGLPAIDGIEATKLLRADPKTKGVLVLALSGHGGAAEQRATAAGVDRYIRKPCLPSVLVEHLRELLASR